MPGQPIALSDDDLDQVSGGVDRLSPSLLAPDTTQPIDVLLLEVMAAMKDTQMSEHKEKVALDQETKRTQLEEREFKLEEAASKLEESKKGDSLSIEQKAMQWAGAFMSTQVAALLVASQANGLPNLDQFKAVFDSAADKAAETLGKIDPNLATLVESQLEKYEAQLMAQLFGSLPQKHDAVAQAGKAAVPSSMSDSAGSAGKVRA